METVKRLYRSKTNKIWLGILGGLGEYLRVDPVVLRLSFLAILIFTGFIPGLLFYIIGALIVPKKPR
ncbi:MAG: PspC domain-containing protein [Patescibacteria group bacterium]